MSSFEGNRWAIIGVGNQGKKHLRTLGANCALQVDTQSTLEGLKLLSSARDQFRFAVVATPESEKRAYVSGLLALGKSVLVEKPLPVSNRTYQSWARAVRKYGGFVTTSYDHQFDEGVRSFLMAVHEARKDGGKEKWTRVDMEYGFGTADLIGASSWMDFGSGPWELVAPHIMDILLSIDDYPFNKFRFCFSFSDNTAPTAVSASLGGNHSATVLTSYTNWQNTFRLRYFNPGGFIELSGLTKWGPSLLQVFQRESSAGPPRLTKQQEFPAVSGDTYVRLSQQAFVANLENYKFSNLKKDVKIFMGINAGRKSLRKNPAKGVTVLRQV